MLRALLLLLLLALPAAAVEIPACNAARAGAVACLSGRLCECRFERGGSIAGRPDGHRWNCGILRPSCGEAQAPPPATGESLILLPPPHSPWPPPWPR